MDYDSKKIINQIWNSNDKRLWNMGIIEYYHLIDNFEIEKEVEKYAKDSCLIQTMDSEKFYNFLYKTYFVWKYNTPNRLSTCRKILEDAVADLAYKKKIWEIKNSVFELEKKGTDNYREMLNKVMEIPGLGVSGASGLLAVLFPHKYGTVDQFIVKALKCIDGLDEKDRKILDKIKNAENLTVPQAVDLQSIIYKKAYEIGITPRQVDMVLWAVRDKEQLVYMAKREIKWRWIIDTES